MKITFPATPLMLALAATFLLPACSARRVDPYRDTKDELRDGRALPAALLEFSDQAPDVLMANLPDAPVIKDSKERMTVIIGEMRNLSRTASTDFEVVTSRIRNALINDGRAREDLKFVEYRKRMNNIGAQENIVGGQGTNQSGPKEYDGKTTLLMNLDINEVTRGDTVMYYMNVMLTHFNSNEIVFSDEYVVKVETR